MVFIPRVLDLVKQSALVRFVKFDGADLWYECLVEDGSQDDGLKSIWEFPVPLEDTPGATFLREDKPSFFMRWMRRYIGMLEEQQRKQQEALDELVKLTEEAGLYEAELGKAK